MIQKQTRLVIGLVLAAALSVLLVLAGCAPSSAASAHSAPAATRTSGCLLPTYDEGYQQNVGDPGARCVDTGQPITAQDAAAAHYAPQCQDSGYVPCYHPCYATTSGVPYPTHPVPCPGDVRK